VRVTSTHSNGILIHDLGPKRPLIFARLSLLVLVDACPPICGGVTKHSEDAKYRFPTLFGSLVATLLAAKARCQQISFVGPLCYRENLRWGLAPPLYDHGEP
jgi:hypothetical protein